MVSAAEVIWHDLECGLYREDLPLWREIAEESAPVRLMIELRMKSRRDADDVGSADRNTVDGE